MTVELCRVTGDRTGNEEHGVPIFRKEQRDRIAARAREDALRQPESDRLPPGQVLTSKWPVLHYGDVPVVDLATWRFTATGEVEASVVWTWEEFLSLPQVERTSDIHCVTRWSRFDNRWTGVPTRVVLDRVRPTPSAQYVLVHAAGGFTTNLPLADFAGDDCLFAYMHDGAPLPREHGGPLRLVVPRLYFWKSAKWVTGIELRAGDVAGFWERNGYHMRGDPWRQERFSED
jgi:DMSO/TMAO reductase YedYZ molybdopterin-dependent catalytic subunit